MAKRISEEGIFIGDIVKEYPNMFKIIIYHDGYYLPSSDRKEIKKVNKETRRQDSIHRSLRRTKTTIKDIMLCNRFDYWCTFTYNCRSCYPKCDNNPCTCNPSTCKRFDINYTRRTLQNWYRNQKKHSPNLKSLAVPDPPKCGIDIPPIADPRFQAFNPSIVVADACNRTKTFYQTFPLATVAVNFSMALFFLWLVVRIFNKLTSHKDDDMIGEV